MDIFLNRLLEYSQHNIMFLGIFNAVFLNIFNYLPHLELKNRSIQIVFTSFVLISNIGIKRFDCPVSNDKQPENPV